MNQQQAINGDLYLPLYELMDPPFTSALALTFELTGELLCQLYVQQQDAISKATDLEGILFAQTKDTIRVGILPSKLNPNLKAGAKILIYIPPGTSVLLKEGSRKVNRVSGHVHRMSLFSLDSDEALLGVSDDEPNFGNNPKAKIWDLESSRAVLPVIQYVRSSKDLVVLESSSASPLPMGPYYLSLFQTTKGSDSYVQELRLSFQTTSICELEVYVHIPMQPITLIQRSTLNSLYLTKHSYDQSLPRGSKVLLYVPATCGKVTITKVTRKLVNPPQRLYETLDVNVPYHLF